MKKSTHPLLQLLVMMAIALGMMIVASLISTPLMARTYAAGGTSAGMPASNLLWTQGITQVLVFLVPVLLMTLVYYRGRQREYYRLDFGRPKWLYGLTGVAIMLLMVPVNDWLTEWNDTWDLGRIGEMMRSLQDQTESVMEQLMGTDTVGGLLANLLVVALLPAVCEETFFRCGVQNLLQRWFDGRSAAAGWPESDAGGQTPLYAARVTPATHGAIWLTAVVFSLGHGELFAFMPRLVMGATLGYLYVYGGSVLPNMLAHFVNNALVVVLYWLVARGVLDVDPEAPLRVDALLTACCTLAAIALFATTFFRRRGELKKTVLQ